MASKQTPAAPEKKRQVFRAQGKVSSVGRKIAYELIRVISETGEDLGIMHRADVIRLMDRQGLKLVLLDQNKDPPVYQLMSGKQIHQEQLKQREKAKPATVQLKELTFSPCIASHDLHTKLKQVESWLEKKNHVRITLRPGRNDPKDNLDTTLEQMVQKMKVLVGFVSKPTVIRNGQAAMCVLRQASAKEIMQANKEKNKTAPPQSAVSSSTTAQSNTSPVSATDTTEGSVPQ
uniref:Translation initiation factor IF-3, mitochondrial n=1 Tax=Lates calcarifer TaxID=8187 RepID=A0A4W6FQW9_LATCA